MNANVAPGAAIPGEAGSADGNDIGQKEMSDHMKAMWAGQSNILVALRVRPLMKHDQVKKACARVLDKNVVVIMDPAVGDKQNVLRANRTREKQYAFDYVFEPKATQESCYLHTAKFLIHGVLDGYNATVFAYGQTGSGKTYTMIGTESEPGIMVRVMEDLFMFSRQEGADKRSSFKVSVSFLEVYNENIRDLLSDVEEYLDLREDPIKGPVVASITEIEATSSKAIMQLLHQGNAKRSQAATAANEVSSRSHAVLQVVVESRDRAPGTVANIKVGKLSLVDLAGSERAANTKNVGARLVEGANINRSLLALGNCINALGEKGNKGNFVPYRDSKLTRLLKDSLGGNCRTVMIANISSAESSFEETLNTLKYANRAKNIKTHAQRNVLNVNYHISEYVALINNLRGEIQVLKGQIGQQPPPATSAAGLVPISGSAAQLFAPSIDVSGDGDQHQQGKMRSPQGGQRSPLLHHARGPSTPFHALRESMRSGTSGGGSSSGGVGSGGGVFSSTDRGNSEARELVNNMRQRIVENFQERMQLRRSLIELEDQNVQNSIEVSKRQLLVVQWSEHHGSVYKLGPDGEQHSAEGLTKQDFAADIVENGSPEIVEAWSECEQLRKAIMKNNGMKRNIAKRLRHNEKEAENFRTELGDKITGEDRRELMELQYQVGRLELENMELEQHRIVHESILKGKDLEIQKLKLQLAVRDKLINRQQHVLIEHQLDNKVGYSQLALLEQTLMNESEFHNAMVPPSPPRSVSALADSINYAPYEEKKQQHNTGNSSGSNNNNSGGDRRRSDGFAIGEQPGIAAAGADNNSSSSNRRGGGRQIAAKSGGGPQVPRLKIDDRRSAAAAADAGSIMKSALLDSEDEDDNCQYQNAEGDEEDEEDDEYNAPLSERQQETVLTSRDRDFIEQGEWSEINSELSDNDNAFLQGAHHNGNQRKNRKDKSSASAANGKAAVAPIGAIASSKSAASAVHGPRGGRHFRSVPNTEDISGSNSNNNSSNSRQHAPPRQHGGNGGSHHDGFVIEDSDEDNTVTGKQPHAAAAAASKEKKPSPRRGSDRLDPIPLVHSSDEHGLLSGRKFDKIVGSGGNLSGRRDSKGYSPLNGSSKDDSGGSGGFAAIYPTTTAPPKSSNISSNYGNSNSSNSNSSYSIGNSNSNSNAVARRGSRSNSSVLEEELSEAGLGGVPGGDGDSSDIGLIIKSKGLGNKISKLKQRTNNSAIAAAAVNSSNSDAQSVAESDSAAAAVGLNVYGSGFANGGGSVATDRLDTNAAVRPSKIKASGRPGKLLSKPVLSSSGGDASLSVDGSNVSSLQQQQQQQLQQLQQEDASLQGRMRSLPALHKQSSGNSGSLSARGDVSCS